MTRFFNRLFNIHANEWQRILFLYGIYTLFMVGIGWGGAVVSASFLTQVGIEFLPVAFVVEAVIMVIAVAIYSAFVDRVPNDIVLMAIVGIGIIAVVIGRIILALDAPTVAFPILYLLFLVIANMFPLQWWNYIDEFYDTLTAKRAVPFIASGLQVGTIMAGLTLPFLNRLITPNNVILLWMLCMVGVVALIHYMPKLTGDRVAANIQARTSEALPYRKRIREGYDYVVKSKFLIWMAANTLFLTILMAFVGYQADKILLENLEVTENLANFIARLMGFINFIMLPIQILMFSRIVSRLGVENTNLIFPVGSLTVVGAMVTLPANILIGSLGVFNRTAFRKTFQSPVEILMYNTIPLRVKGRIGAVIAGAVTPLGGIIGGLSLIALLPIIKDRWQLAILMGGVAILYVGVSWVLRREYTSALLQTLEDEDFSFLLSSASEVNLVDSTTINWLSKRLETADSDQLKLFVAQLLAQVAGSESVAALEPLAREGSVRIRRGVADILVVNQIRSERVGRLYLELLKDEDAQVRRAAIEGLETLFEGGEQIRFLNLALQVLRDDPSLDVKTQVMPALIQSGDIFFMGTAFHYLSDLLNDERADHRMRAVRVLEQIDDVRLIRNLIDVLHDEEDEVRLTAAITAERLAQDHEIPSWMHATIFEAFEMLLHDPVERIRQAAILVIGHLDTSEAFNKLLPSLTDPSLPIRHVTVEAFGAAGKASIPTLDDALESDDTTLEKYVTAALARIDHIRFRDYLTPHIRDNLRIIYHNHGWLATLRRHHRLPIVSILESMLKEANYNALEEVFYFLSVGYDANAVNRIHQTLQNEATRPFAAEALESMANADVARLISVLYDPQHDSAALFQLHHEEMHEELPTLTEIVQTLYANKQDDWERTLAVYLLGELADEIPTAECKKILDDAENSTNLQIQRAVRSTRRILEDAANQTLIMEDLKMLSTLEKVIFLKQVPLFDGMSVEELKLLAGISKEVFFEQSKHVFRQGDIGETMYIIVNGSMGIELEDKEKDTVNRIATRSGYEFFGEMALFTAEPRSATVTAIKDTLTLEIQGDSLMKLARQYPDLALGLIRVLSVRLRDASSQLAQAQSGKSRMLLDMFDKLDK